MTQEQAAGLRAIASIFIDTVKECSSPVGVPGGIMYAAVIDKMTLQQFEQIMSGLVRAGKLRKSGECYHFVADL